MHIQRAASALRVNHFTTKLRETTRGIYVTYTWTPCDPRIDAGAMDTLNCQAGRFGLGAHYVIRVDGTIEIGRHPMTIGAYGPRRIRHDHIIVVLVGGMDEETSKQVFTINQAQRDALEWLYQSLADALQAPLKIDEHVQQLDPEVIAEEQRIEEQEAAMAAAGAPFS